MMMLMWNLYVTCTRHFPSLHRRSETPLYQSKKKRNAQWWVSGEFRSTYTKCCLPLTAFWCSSVLFFFSTQAKQNARREHNGFWLNTLHSWVDQTVLLNLPPKKGDVNCTFPRVQLLCSIYCSSLVFLLIMWLISSALYTVVCPFTLYVRKHPHGNLQSVCMFSCVIEVLVNEITNRQHFLSFMFVSARVRVCVFMTYRVWYPPCTHKWLENQCSHGSGGEEVSIFVFFFLPMSTYMDAWKWIMSFATNEKNIIFLQANWWPTHGREKNHWLCRMARLNCPLGYWTTTVRPI